MELSSGVGWRIRWGCSLLLLSLLLPAWAEPLQKPLIVTNSKSWPPFSYLNDEGQPEGLLIDLWREYGRVTGRPIQFKLVEWGRSLELLRSGKADVHAGLLWSPERAQGYDYGSSLSHLDGQLFFTSALRGTAAETYLSRHGTVGVVAAGYEEYYARKHFPSTPLQTFTDNDAMMAAAFSGKLDAFIADLTVANYFIYTSSDPTRYIPVRHLYSDEVRFAVRAGDQALLQQLEQGFAKVSEGDRLRIMRKWMHIQTVYPAHFWPWLLALAGMVLLLYIVQLRRAVASRTVELRLANARLQHLASTDPMTGILNRRAFLPQLARQLTRLTPMGLLLFDLDRFKGINDRFGHRVGDEVLSILVARIQLILPRDCLFARLGGEEFCIALAIRDLAALQYWAEQIGVAVSEHKMQTSAGALGLSISVGGVWVAASAQAEPASLLHQADNLMYLAKSLGRNTWQVAAYDATAAG